jgi:hypothetical protein
VRKFYGAVLVSLGLSGCLGYQIGPVKPNYLSDVHTLAVPTFKNSTIMPRIEVLVTGTVIKQLQQDGTFEIVNEHNADAVLEGEIVRITRSPARSVRGNVLATAEFSLSLHVKYKLVGRDGQQIGPNFESTGSTNFFVSTDVQTDERQAFPLAAEELATRLVSQLGEGW